MGGLASLKLVDRELWRSGAADWVVGGGRYVDILSCGTVFLAGRVTGVPGRP